MANKEYLVMVLTGLEKDRPVAANLKKFVLMNAFDNQSIAGLTETLKQTVSIVTDTAKKARLQKSITALEKIQELESEDAAQTEERVKELESILNNL